MASSSIGNAGGSDGNEAHSASDGLGGKTMGEKTVGKPRQEQPRQEQPRQEQPPKARPAPRGDESPFDETNVE